MTLAESPAHCDVRVVQVRASDGLRLRLGELGVQDGATLRVWKRLAFGARVVVVGGSRLALDAGTAAGVEVDPLTVAG